jgi:division protein 1
MTTNPGLLNDRSPSLQTRGLEAFGRKVTATASHLMGPLDPIANPHYHAAMAEMQKQLQRPTIQRGIFSLSRTTPRDLLRSSLATSAATDMGHRALTYLPDALLADIPDPDGSSYSLFQGFQATHPDLADDERSRETVRGRARRRGKQQRGRKLLAGADSKDDDDASPVGGRNKLEWLKKERASMMHELELLGIRKNLATGEIRDIDAKIANLHDMRNLVLDKLAGLEQEEAMIDHDCEWGVEKKSSVGRVGSVHAAHAAALSLSLCMPPQAMALCLQTPPG